MQPDRSATVAWWWAIRQAFSVPDIVSDVNALTSIVENLAAEYPDDQLREIGWDRVKVRHNVRTVVQLIVQHGEAGKLDGLLVDLGRETTNERAISDMFQGQAQVFIEDRPAADAALSRVTEWIKQNPRLPRIGPEHFAIPNESDL